VLPRGADDIDGLALSRLSITPQKFPEIVHGAHLKPRLKRFWHRWSVAASRLRKRSNNLGRPIIQTYRRYGFFFQWSVESADPAYRVSLVFSPDKSFEPRPRVFSAFLCYTAWFRSRFLSSFSRHIENKPGRTFVQRPAKDRVAPWP